MRHSGSNRDCTSAASIPPKSKSIVRESESYDNQLATVVEMLLASNADDASSSQLRNQQRRRTAILQAKFDELVSKVDINSFIQDRDMHISFPIKVGTTPQIF